jgi:MFS family permease
MQLPGGVLADKYGPKIVMSVSMIMCSTTSLFMPVATLRGGWVGLYVLKVLQGVSQVEFLQYSDAPLMHDT